MLKFDTFLVSEKENKPLFSTLIVQHIKLLGNISSDFNTYPKDLIR